MDGNGLVYVIYRLAIWQQRGVQTGAEACSSDALYFVNCASACSRWLRKQASYDDDDGGGWQHDISDTMHVIIDKTKARPTD